MGGSKPCGGVGREVPSTSVEPESWPLPGWFTSCPVKEPFPHNADVVQDEGGRWIITDHSVGFLTI